MISKESIYEILSDCKSSLTGLGYDSMVTVISRYIEEKVDALNDGE